MVRRKNKKGYLKTLEAVISIVGILLFTFGVTPREVPNPSKVPFVVENAQDFILEELSNNDVIRHNVINADLAVSPTHDSVTKLIESNLPVGYAYEYKICEETTCLAENPPPDVSVYSADLVITGMNDAKEPKARIVRMWFWRV